MSTYQREETRRGSSDVRGKLREATNGGCE